MRGAEVQSLKAQVGIFTKKLEFLLFQLQLFGKHLIFRLQGHWDGGERASIESPRGDQQEVSALTDDAELCTNIDPMDTNILKLMQRGGRLIAATPRGAEEDNRPHSGDEHVKLFEVS